MTTKNEKQILAVVLPLIVLLCFGIWYVRADPTAEIRVESDTPVWDLRHVDMREHYVRLRGGNAEFVPQAFLLPDEFDQRGDIQTGKPEKIAQYYTGRIRLLVPEGQIYAVTASSVDYADRIYINGVLMQTVGSPGESAEAVTPLVTSVYYTVTPVNGVIEVLHQSSNFVHKEGGGAAGLRIGSVESVSRYFARQTQATAIIMGGCAFLFIVHLVLYLLLRSYRTNLYFALFCLVWFFRTGVTGTKALTAMFPTLSWYLTFRMEYMAIPLSALLLTLALAAMFQGLVQRGVRLAAIIALSASALFFAVAPTVLLTQVLPLIYGIVLFTAAYILARFALLLVKRRRTEAFIMLFALVIFVYVAVREMFYHAGILIFPAVHSGMLDFASLVFILFQMTAAFLGTMWEVAKARQGEQVALLEAEALRRDALLKEALHKAIPKDSLVIHGVLSLNTLAGQAFLNSEDLLLTPKEFALLHLLMQYEGEAVSRERLFEEVWKRPLAEDDQALKSTVSRLRKKLLGSGYQVRAVRGSGYRFEPEEDKSP